MSFELKQTNGGAVQERLRSVRGRTRELSPVVAPIRDAALAANRKPALDRCGYPVLKLSAGGVTRSFSLAGLVAAAFLPPMPFPGAILGDRDGDKANCAAGNLFWGAQSDPEFGGCMRPRLSDRKVAEVLALRGALSVTAIAEHLGVSKTTIYRIFARVAE